MAFATTNVQTINLGGGLKIVRGKWTGTMGDATGTITIGGCSQVWMGSVWSNAAGNWVEAPFSFSVSGAKATVTVENAATVTDGQFAFLVS